MKYENKITIIVILLLIDIMASLLDLYEEFSSDENGEKKITNSLLTSKIVLDIPFMILSIYLLLNIKFNPLIYLFIFLNYGGMLEDYYVSNHPSLLVDKNTKKILTSYVPLTIDALSLLIGGYVFYNLFGSQSK